MWAWVLIGQLYQLQEWVKSLKFSAPQMRKGEITYYHSILSVLIETLGTSVKLEPTKS